MSKSLRPQVLFVTLLAGCDFFFPPEPPPPPVTSIACGETVLLDGRPTGDALDVEADNGQSLLLLPEMGPVGSIIRLDLPGDLGRALPFWNPLASRVELPWIHTAQGGLTVTLYVPDGGTATGELVLQCKQPPELCADVVDDDGDGLADCADSDCASDPGCAEAQTPRLQVDPGCLPWSGPLPDADPLDDQLLFYRDRGEQIPDRSWRGGAEIELLVEDTATISSTLGGMACEGAINGSVVNCDSLEPIVADEDLVLSAGIWLLEPEGPMWPDLRVTPGCSVR